MLKNNKTIVIIIAPSSDMPKVHSSSLWKSFVSKSKSQSFRVHVSWTLPITFWAKMIECRWVHHITDHPKGSCVTFRPYTLHVNILLCWLRAPPVCPIIPCITESVLCAVHTILRCLLELCVRSSVPLNRLCQHLRCCFICWYVASSVFAFIVLCWRSHIWFWLQLARWVCFISHRWLVMFYLVL